MGQITVFSYPVEVILEHDDTVIDTVTDEWGTHDVYQIHKVYWSEVAGQHWVAIVAHPTTGNPVVQEIPPGDSGSKNLPTPARFPSYPLITHCTLVRG